MTEYFIFGYGVPKDIMIDEQYRRYLSFVFNAIYAASANNQAMIVFCGGKTDCIKAPYARTEAEEMKKLFTLLAERPFVREQTSAWRYGTVKTTLSSLENILAAVERLRKRPAVIFCEMTRAERVRTLARRAFGKKKATVIPVDFDMSPNRYLEVDFLARRERHDLRCELAALADKKKLADWRAHHKRKLAFFRTHGYARDPNVVRQWWEEEMKK